ncbi:hypothetical protein [Phosphitispora fastidiosa]|uniref:hypothetical protein n=1 Tax=Phosphitispora fastidiosa TaxID=2837202 RepID=UPI001E44730E|nr:hypothetical protein [Phosphitispora fastidiosa]MBU7006490.1 glucan phosphoethanolaminetransferase (alkaline phosphatase superfamily) [Phosphitispora fastidiosa]
MVFTIMLKVLLSLTAGLVFWFFAFMVFMVYAFMPINKTANSIIFAILAPTIYLVVTNIILKKLFKETGPKQLAVNFVITLLSMGFALLVIDLSAKIL